MASVSTLVPGRDARDPWGFGLSSGDEMVVIDRLAPLDEVVTPDDPRDAAAMHSAGSAATATDDAMVPAPLETLSAGAARAAAAIRLPFSPERIGILALFAAVIIAQAFYIGLTLTGEASGRTGVGDIVISSHPSGATVTVDGRAYGVTPLVATIDAGAHHVEIAGGAAVPARFDLSVPAGQRITRHVALELSAPAATTATPAAASAPVATGTLHVDASGAPARVAIDGVDAGDAPLTRQGLGVGTHEVSVRYTHGGVAMHRTVTLTAGTTTDLVTAPPAASTAPSGPVSGWIQLETPFDVQVIENGQVVGTSASDRLMLAAGSHRLELANAALGYRALTTV